MMNYLRSMDIKLLPVQELVRILFYIADRLYTEDDFIVSTNANRLKTI